MSEASRSTRIRFLLKALLIGSTTILPLAVGKLAVPLSWYAFRAWEVLIDRRPTATGPFYPNQHLRMTEVGDLAMRTPWAVKKTVEWYTDERGYRNRPSPEPYDAVITGDSFIAGTSLSQEETLAEQLAARSGLRVYAHGGLVEFLRDERFAQRPPRVLIVTQLERNVSRMIKAEKLLADGGVGRRSRRARIAQAWWRALPEGWSIALDQIGKKPLVTEHCYRLVKRRPSVHAVVNAEDGWLFPVYDFSAARIYQANAAHYLELARATIRDYEQVAAGRGLAFVFMAIPDKGNIYRDLAPREQAAGLAPSMIVPELIARLRKDGIRAVDLASAFHRARAQGVQVFHKDDSHWTPAGVAIAAELVQGELRAMGLSGAASRLASHAPAPD